MKSDHRHDLQTNELSKLTVKATKVVDEHGLKIAAVICVLALSIAGYKYWSFQASASNTMGWEQFGVVQSSEGYLGIADSQELENTSVGHWARLIGAEQRLADGIQKMFEDRANAISQLEDSREDFRKLLDDPHPMLKQRAIFGLARCEESLGNLDEAIDAYSQLATEEFASSVYHKEAKERSEYLAKADPQAFYQWFKKQRPKLPEPPKPGDAGNVDESILDFPGNQPFDTKNPLGDDEDLSLPADDDDGAEDKTKSDAKPDESSEKSDPPTKSEPTEPEKGAAADDKDDSPAKPADEAKKEGAEKEPATSK